MLNIQSLLNLLDNNKIEEVKEILRLEQYELNIKKEENSTFKTINLNILKVAKKLRKNARQWIKFKTKDDRTCIVNGYSFLLTKENYNLDTISDASETDNIQKTVNECFLDICSHKIDEHLYSSFCVNKKNMSKLIANLKELKRSKLYKKNHDCNKWDETDFFRVKDKYFPIDSFLDVISMLQKDDMKFNYNTLADSATASYMIINSKEDYVMIFPLRMTRTTPFCDIFENELLRIEREMFENE